MKYLDYHNAQADLFAQRYYGLNYDELTPFMQAIIDGQIAVKKESSFDINDYHDPEFNLRNYLNG